MPNMMILAAAVFLYVLMSLAVYFYVFGLINTSYLRIFQFALYILLFCFALTVGIGVEYVLRSLPPIGTSLAAIE
jgi:hypothetical protein